MATVEVGVVIACHTEDEWKKHYKQGTESTKLVVVDFTASWCGPCKIISPVLAEFAKKYQNVLFLKVDVDELKNVAKEQKIEAMPTFLFFKGEKLVDKLVGAKKEELQRLIEKHANDGASASAE